MRGIRLYRSFQERTLNQGAPNPKRLGPSNVQGKVSACVAPRAGPRPRARSGEPHMSESTLYKLMVATTVSVGESERPAVCSPLPPFCGLDPPYGV